MLHSDLRPSNILVHETTPGARDLLLADFGGSVCEELGLDGLSLPDGPFYSPVFNWRSSVQLDLFGLGSIFYTIHTGRWPYKPTPGRFDKVDDRLEWEDKVVYPNFKQNKFPDDVGGLPAGDVILACWKREFATAKDALTALDKHFGALGKKLKCADRGPGQQSSRRRKRVEEMDSMTTYLAGVEDRANHYAGRPVTQS